MPKPISEQFNRFNAGLTSELRLETEIPRFARTWNFDVTPDRMIQHYGLEELANSQDGFHIVELETRDSGASTGLPYQYLQHGFFGIESDGSITHYAAECGHADTSLTSFSNDVSMIITPHFYNETVVYATDDIPNPEIWVYDINSQTDQQILPAEDFHAKNTFFLEHSQDDTLYIFSGRNVYSFNNPVDGGSSANPYAPYQPITDFMTLGDYDGQLGSYGGFLAPPSPLLITQVSQMQQLLTVMGYYSGPIDGLYGDLTAAAVGAFQTDFTATGQFASYVGGQNAGDPLVVDQIAGPETTSAMSQARPSDLGPVALGPLLTMPDVITAVAEYGGYICIATQDQRGNAVVYFWDRSLDESNRGDIGLQTSVTVGQGAVQLLWPIDGQLTAVMTPASDATCIHRYDRMSIFGIAASFESIPQSKAVLLREYVLRIAGDDSANFPAFQYNYFRSKSVLRGSRLYFTGRIHLQHWESQDNDEGALAGIFSIDVDGNLFHDVTRSTGMNPWTDENLVSFGIMDSGFVLSTEDALYINDEGETDTISGFITKIINASRPELNKVIDNIYLGLHNTSGLDRIELWIREIEDVNETDAGWELAYRGGPTESKFNQRVIINRMEDGSRFAKFRETQVMVKLYGTGAEVTNLVVNYNLLDINE